jgi:hypothetical protein
MERTKTKVQERHLAWSWAHGKPSIYAHLFVVLMKTDHCQSLPEMKHAEMLPELRGQLAPSVNGVMTTTAALSPLGQAGIWSVCLV